MIVSWRREGYFIRNVSSVMVRGVNPVRNLEIEEYQARIRRMRLKFKEEFKMLPTKSQQEEIERKRKAEKRTREWTKFIQGIKTQLKNPHSELLRDRHPCRPVVNHNKSPEQRMIGQKNLSKALTCHQIMKRRCLTLLSTQLSQTSLGTVGDAFITHENLDSRIQKAILNPVNYNVRPEALVEEELKLRNSLAALRVRKDPHVYAVGRPTTTVPSKK